MTINQLKKSISGNKYAIFTLSYSPDNQFLVCGGEDKIVHFYDTKNYEESFILNDSRDSIWCTAFSPDGKLFACGGADKVLRIYDLKRRALKNQLKYD